MQESTLHTFPDFLPFSPKDIIYILKEDMAGAATEKTTAEPVLPYLILVDRTPLPPAEEELLRKILQAIPLPWEQVQLRALAEAPPLSERSHVFVFADQLPEAWAALPYHLPTSLGACPCLRSHTLAALDQDRQKKLALWAALKKVFH